MTVPAPSTSLYTDFKGISDLRRDAQAKDPTALREAARQFESLFTRMMLKSMRDASFGDPMLGSDQQDFYRDMFDDQFAVEMSKGRGLGLADMLVQQLTRAGLAPPTAAGAGSGATSLNTTSVTGAASTTATDPSTTRFDGSPEKFVRELWPVAQAAGRELGVDPRHILAQAALETGWGRSVPSQATGASSNNFFGIKPGSHWDGATVSVRTLEFENGLPVAKRDSFRSYDSPEACFEDYVSLLKNNPRYAATLNTGDNTHAFARGLQSGGYATDPAYASKVTAIAQNLPSMTVSLKSAGLRPIAAGTDPI